MKDRLAIQLGTATLTFFIAATLLIQYLVRYWLVLKYVDNAYIHVILSTIGQLRGEQLQILSGCYVLSLIGYGISQRHIDKQLSTIYIIVLALLALISSGLLINSYTGVFYYDLYIYPLLFIITLFSIPRSLNMLLGYAKDKDFFKSVNKKHSDFYFTYATHKHGTLYINDIRQATLIEGLAKAGKSASVLQPTIVQACEQDFAGLIYDYEGDFTEKGGGVLSRTAYTAKKEFGGKTKFACINFRDMTRTKRCNPINPKYMQSYNHCLELATVMMLNLNRQWISKMDFWAENAIATFAGAIYYHVRNRPDACTLPHVVEFLLNNFSLALLMMKQDQEVAAYIAPIIVSLEQGAGGQLAGAQSSTQLPLSKLRSPETYYVFHPDPEDEFSLNITHPENPYLLALCNAPELQNSIAPAIGAITQVVVNQMNKLGKHKSIFLFDELPTIFIYKIDKLVAEARKKNVCCFFAVQTFDQLVRDYGQVNAKVIRETVGNQFMGITGVPSAEYMSKMVGDYQKSSQSHSVSDHGQTVTTSERRDKILEPNVITSQQPGEFTGRISGGEPPFFKTRFKLFEYNSIDIPHFNSFSGIEDQSLNNVMIQTEVETNMESIKTEVMTWMNGYAYLLDAIKTPKDKKSQGY